MMMDAYDLTSKINVILLSLWRQECFLHHMESLSFDMPNVSIVVEDTSALYYLIISCSDIFDGMSVMSDV